MSLDLTILSQSIQTLRRSLDATQLSLPSLSPVLQETVKAGIIQHFEIAYEQCWKMMKRWLENNLNPESVDGVTRQELYRLAAENHLIQDVALWMKFHRGRNLTSHTYSQKTADEVYGTAVSFISEAERFLQRIEAVK